MSIQIGDNFSYNGQKSIDQRMVFNTISDMKNTAETTLYDGLFSYCKANKKYYTFNSENTVDETTGKWRDFTSGGSGSNIVECTQAEYDALTEIDDDTLYFITDAEDESHTYMPSTDTLDEADDNHVPTAKCVKDAMTNSISNPNLLDNPWFTINQRGQTSYSGEGTYALDRWRIYLVPSGTGRVDLINGNKIKLSDGFFDFGQAIPNTVLPNKPNLALTMSMMLDNGKIVHKTFTLKNDGMYEYINSDVVDGLLMRYIRNWDANLDLFMFQNKDNNSPNIIACKLEMGTQSTLHLDVAPNYTAELLKCQRYLRFIGVGDSAYKYNDNEFQFMFRFPVEMYSNPTPTLLKTNFNVHTPVSNPLLQNCEFKNHPDVTKYGISCINIQTTTDLSEIAQNGIISPAEENVIMLSAEL